MDCLVLGSGRRLLRAWLVSVTLKVGAWGLQRRQNCCSMSCRGGPGGTRRRAAEPGESHHGEPSRGLARNLRTSYSREKSLQLAFLFSCYWQVIYKYCSWRFSHPCLSTRIVLPVEQSTVTSIQTSWSVWFEATIL